MRLVSGQCASRGPWNTGRASRYERPVPPPPQKPEDQTRAFLIVGVMFVVVIVMAAAIDHPRKRTQQSARADALETKHLNSDDSISAWRTAPSSARDGLSRSMVRRITTGLSDAAVNARADQLARCINGTAGDGSDTRLDYLTITQAAAMCAATMGLNQ